MTDFRRKRTSCTAHLTNTILNILSPFPDFSKTYTVVLAKIINKLKMTENSVEGETLVSNNKTI